MNWYLTAKYGLYVTVAYEGPGTGEHRCCGCYPDGKIPQSVDEFADAFDVETFVRDCVEMGVEYVTFTAYHAHLYIVYPSETIEKYLPGHTSRRDLIRELIDSLHARGIKLQLYIHFTIGDTMTEEERRALHWYEAADGYSKYNNFVNEFADELTKRYGDEVDSYYIDMTHDVPFLDMIDRPRLYHTIKSNAPNAPIVGNGEVNEGVDYGSREDCGEEIEDVSERKAFPVQRVICQTPMWWTTVPQNGKNAAKYSAEHLYKTLVLNAAANVYGGGLAVGASPYVTSGFEPSVKESLTALKRFIEPVSESILGTVPSTSYVTPSGIRIQESNEGVFAVRSADGSYEYLHVLIPPEGNVLRLPVPLDGAVFGDAVMLPSQKSAKLLQDENGVVIEIPEAWNKLDTVIKIEIKEIPVKVKIQTYSLPQAEICVTASGECAEHPAKCAVDGNRDTFWQTGYGEMHYLDIDLGKIHRVAGLRILPRQDGTSSEQLLAHVSVYGIYAGTEKNKLRPVATGEWGRTLEEKKAEFLPVKARYIRLAAGPGWLPRKYCVYPAGTVSIAELYIDVVEQI